MKKKILFVVTSHDKIGGTGKTTGFYLAEVTHPWKVLRDAGYKIDFVSPLGGKVPVDSFDLNDPVNKEFWEDAHYRNKIEHTLSPEEVVPGEYDAIYYAGGFGAMWDFPDHKKLAEIAATIYESGGVVAAVCHGPAGLVNVRLSDGSYLVRGRRINSFTDEEERMAGLDRVVPFLLESKLVERGARFEKSEPHQPHVVVDGRLVTGQNPRSAGGVGRAILAELEQLER